MKLKKKKKTTKKTSLKAKLKAPASRRGVLKAAKHLRKTTKKMVDDVFLRFVGMRVLERAQQMSATLKAEKAQAELAKKKRSRKKKKKG
jgi:hypothetical protein